MLFTIVYCHYNEIIHRDVKPENISFFVIIIIVYICRERNNFFNFSSSSFLYILLTRKNDIDSIKLTDFGLASLKVGEEV